MSSGTNFSYVDGWKGDKNYGYTPLKFLIYTEAKNTIFISAITLSNRVVF